MPVFLWGLSRLGPTAFSRLRASCWLRPSLVEERFARSSSAESDQNLSGAGIFSRFLEPLLPSKIEEHCQAGGDNNSPDHRIAPLPIELRHKFEVHSV